MIKVSRRSLLSGMAAVALPPGFAAAEVTASPVKQRTVDEFLDMASPDELVAYHSNALLEAMRAKRPDRLWRVQIDSEGEFILVVARTPKEPSA